MKSILTKDQKKFLTKEYTQDGSQYKMTVRIQYDDECGNGHNTFSITADIKYKDSKGRWQDYMNGCCHESIIKHMPELKEAIKWHLVSSNGPMHYISNTVYHASKKYDSKFSKGKEPDLEAARACAVWPDATLEQLRDKEALEARLPKLLAEFKEMVESFGFTY